MNNKYLNGTGLTQVWTKITNLLSGKVDVVEGKELSSNDYTDAEKTKLAGLSNYDDTALSGRVTTIENAGYQTSSQVTTLINNAIAEIDIPECQALTTAEITEIIGS